MSSLNLGLIGNCSVSALVDDCGRIVWFCQPRFDSDPFFCNLLADDPGFEKAGFWSIEIDALKARAQHYERNSAILTTTLTSRDGSILEITDFIPRFRNFERNFRPTMIVRQLRPLAGTPKVRIRLRPALDYGAHTPEISRGSNHIRYVASGRTMRLTTDATISDILDESWFLLDRPIDMVLGPDESFTSSLHEAANSFRDRTRAYWSDWSRSLSIPFEWQKAVIRAAITLKLSTYEETGAIVAAMTTSIPESPGSGRNWDYRFCWLRDAYFVIHALNRLSATRTLELYLRYINNIVANSDTGASLQPLYGLSAATELAEATTTSLPGYRGDGPVRVGNDAFRQVQNDVYGSVILAAAQSFFDSRLTHPAEEKFYRKLVPMGRRAIERFDKPDAGLWELRTREAVHTFSAVMCWAAADRLARIAHRLGHNGEAKEWADQAAAMRTRIMREAWNEEMGCYAASFGGDQLDASLLLMHELGFHAADDEAFVATVLAIDKRLRRGSHVFRYVSDDDFGRPEKAFTVCTFWLIEALAVIGRREEARRIFEHLLDCRNPLGLLSEDIDPETNELWGNFPQTYSMVGLIKCAMRLSRKWEDAF
jgi:GH15 family glucan-1,4-alpha-glucosidase